MPEQNWKFHNSCKEHHFLETNWWKLARAKGNIFRFNKLLIGAAKYAARLRKTCMHAYLKLHRLSVWLVFCKHLNLMRPDDNNVSLDIIYLYSQIWTWHCLPLLCNWWFVAPSFKLYFMWLDFPSSNILPIISQSCSIVFYPIVMVWYYYCIILENLQPQYGIGILLFIIDLYYMQLFLDQHGCIKRVWVKLRRMSQNYPIWKVWFKQYL